MTARALLVLELAHVEVAPGRPDRPAEEHVADRLEPALAGDDPLAVAGAAARSEEPFEDRRLGLLGLEEQRIVPAAVVEQGHEGRQADAAHPDDLERGVDEPVALDEHPSIFLERVAVGRQRRDLRGQGQLGGWVTTGGWSTIRRTPPWPSSVSLGSSCRLSCLVVRARVDSRNGRDRLST